jgi:signal transduction histidine kinase
MNINLITNLDKVLFSGDRLKIQRMLINIVDNALKYNKKYGTITVSLSQVKKSAELRLSNTGPAIPHADLANIFDQFYRVDKSHSSRVDGFGLGLTIVKKIVELHDGTISASSTDVETSIRISMPIRQVKTE